MAIGANSYGDTGEIAALVPKHASPQIQFDAATRPTLTRVEGLVDQVSEILNAILETAGFDTPITNARVTEALDSFVNEAVAEIVEGINGYGRFGPTKQRGGASRWRGTILTEAKEYITEMAVGFERMGATRSYDLASGILTRSTDESGDAINPIFQRKAFGNRFTNWDS